MAISHDAHTVKQFDVLLANLRNLVLEMGGLVEEQIQHAIQALDDEDLTAAREVVARDQVINGLQVKADEDCVSLIALRQPLGSDLRLIMSLSKIVTDLERIGDEAEKIARMTIKTYDGDSSPPSAKLLRDVVPMAKLAQNMLHNCLDALARLDVGKAVEVARAMGAALEGAVRFGANGADPFGRAGAARLRCPDVIVFSLSARVRGYHSGISRTFAFSEPSPRYRQIYHVVRQAQEEAFRAARPGIPAGKVDEAARSAIHRGGLGKYFTHGVGHGVGLDESEEPILASGNDIILEDGMVVAMGPGIYLPGEFGVRLEDVVLVTPTGPRHLPAMSAPSP